MLSHDVRPGGGQAPAGHLNTGGQSVQDLRKHQSRVRQLFRKLKGQPLPDRGTWGVGAVTFQRVTQHGVCHSVSCAAPLPEKLAFAYPEDLY